MHCLLYLCRCGLNLYAMLYAINVIVCVCVLCEYFVCVCVCLPVSVCIYNQFMVCLVRVQFYLTPDHTKYFNPISFLFT